MPILRGDACRLVLLGSHYEQYHQYTSPTGAFTPLCRPICGIYDDYGFIQFKDEFEAKYFYENMRLMQFEAPGVDPESCRKAAYDFLSSGKARLGDMIGSQKGNFCFISETAYQHLSCSLEQMKCDIETLLYPVYREELELALVGSDPFVMKLAKSQDPRNFFQFHLAKHPKVLSNRPLHLLAMYGLSFTSPMHHMALLRLEGLVPLALLQTIGELQVLNEFLIRVRGFWSQQAFHMDAATYVNDYAILLRMMQADMERLSKHQDL
jgi:hypothetical protein